MHSGPSLSLAGLVHSQVPKGVVALRACMIDMTPSAKPSPTCGECCTTWPGSGLGLGLELRFGFGFGLGLGLGLGFGLGFGFELVLGSG